MTESQELAEAISVPTDIFGWFSWPELYDRAVETAPYGATLVEVGVFFGRSLAYLGQRAKEANKGLRVVGIDTFKGSPEFDGGLFVQYEGRKVPILEMPSGFILQQAFENLDALGLMGTVSLIVSDSAQAASLFADRSCHMVFIDADHQEPAVARDIDAWTPKVAFGGIMAGHDYDDGFPGVIAAVDRAFGSRVESITGNCWEVRL